MRPSVRRLRFLSELASLGAIGLMSTWFALALADEIFANFERAETIALERSVVFLENQLDDRLAIFSAYAEDAFRGIDPTHSPDMSAGFIVSVSDLIVRQILPGGDDHAYFVGYRLGDTPNGRFLAGLRNGQIAHSGVIRSPESDSPMICYAERRGDLIVAATSGVSSLSRVLERARDVVGGGYVLTSYDGFPFVSTVGELAGSVQWDVTAQGLHKEGEWYHSSRRARILGGVLHKLAPVDEIDPLLAVVRFSAAPIAVLLILLAFGKFLVEYRLIVKPLEGLAASLGSWPARALARPGAMVAELETVYHAFGDAEGRTNTAHSALAAARDALAAANRELEARVANRTAALVSANQELALGNRKLGAAIDQLTKTQDDLLTQEKMAALGRLSSGVAHELNTPLGAILSVTDRIDDSGAAHARQWIARVQALSKGDSDLLVSLLERAGGKPESRDPVQARARSEGLRKLLSAKGPAEARRLAGLMAELGLDAAQPETVELAANPMVEELIAIVNALTVNMRSLELVRSAATAAARVVDALKSYSWESPGAEPEAVDLGRQISDVLVLMNDRIKRGFALKVSLPTGLIVMADPNRLAQVWINLINNALQAMAGAGTLGIRAERDGDSIRVSISDDGPGIPEEIQPRIFEPFFTTKPKGEGTGLGLDICRRLVGAAGGEIGFSSRPGETVFSVSLPAVRDESGGDYGR